MNGDTELYLYPNYEKVPFFCKTCHQIGHQESSCRKLITDVQSSEPRSEAAKHKAANQSTQLPGTEKHWVPKVTKNNVQTEKSTLDTIIQNNTEQKSNVDTVAQHANEKTVQSNLDTVIQENHLTTTLEIIEAKIQNTSIEVVPTEENMVHDDQLPPLSNNEGENPLKVLDNPLSSWSPQAILVPSEPAYTENNCNDGHIEDISTSLTKLNQEEQELLKAMPAQINLDREEEEFSKDDNTTTEDTNTLVRLATSDTEFDGKMHHRRKQQSSRICTRSMAQASTLILTS
ncbi:hypothetical protein JCGZ_04228 [Jatropha curcas]|uniref:Uncharacterized protein n=1 Tax=Jatropha curcas TaxID=180498 RepID=A0A067J9Y6_JATCU|nr:hypothetical protein JCGZ_04228 [Jatropha curcas]